MHFAEGVYNNVLYARNGAKKERRIRMKKRIASILLAVMMIVTLLPLGLVDTAWAATVVGSGDCSGYNSNVTWKLTSDGTLTISGTGYMKAYYVYNGEYARGITSAHR